VSVLNWNVYYGADLDVLLDSDRGPLPYRSLLVLQQVMATDAPARAQAIARHIAAEQPHLVGLQEVPVYRLQTPGDLLTAAPYPNAPESSQLFDFVDLLLAALEAQGAEYVVAARTWTLDAELPILNAELACCDDLRFMESVVVLARRDVRTANRQEHTFAVNLPVELEGQTMPIVKGWASVDATVKGRTYRFVTTHLEPADIGPGHAIIPEVHAIQMAQASELLAFLNDSPRPVILTGDLNSEPGGTSTATYGMVMDAGFVDAWLVGPPRGNGFTANHSADLLNAESELWHRIDFVLYRDEFTARGGPFRGAVHARVVGDRQADRTPGGLWPSDHAGIVAVLRPLQQPTR
jgi:endonuclease/exonuclease/phosphatase family metal-dependent hydrolase